MRFIIIIYYVLQKWFLGNNICVYALFLIFLVESMASTQSDVSRLDIRVGFIRSCKKHESADTLYVEEIDMGDGDGNCRTVVSGLVNWYPLEQMMVKFIIYYYSFLLFQVIIVSFG